MTTENNFRRLYNDRGVGVIFRRDTTSWWNVTTWVRPANSPFAHPPQYTLFAPQNFA